MNEKPFKVPDQLLQQLNEFSNGGFIFIRVGEGNNPPDVYMSADNMIISMGLIEFARIWANTCTEANENALTDAMIDEDPDADSDDLED